MRTLDLTEDLTLTDGTYQVVGSTGSQYRLKTSPPANGPSGTSPTCSPTSSTSRRSAKHRRAPSSPCRIQTGKK